MHPIDLNVGQEAPPLSFTQLMAVYRIHPFGFSRQQTQSTLQFVLYFSLTGFVLVGCAAFTKSMTKIVTSQRRCDESTLASPATDLLVTLRTAIVSTLEKSSL
jgi:hypothetical protein